MSQTDLFGNPIPSSSSSGKKTFKLLISTPISNQDKKKKSEIYAHAKSIKALELNIQESITKVEHVKCIYNKLIGQTIITLEERWLILLDALADYLPRNDIFSAWEMELIYHLLNTEIRLYTQYNFDVDKLIHIQANITQFETINKEQHTPLEYISQDDNELAFETLEPDLKKNSKDRDDQSLNSFSTFKKLYKSLLKQVHPDVLFISSEESETSIKTLTKIWENKAYYQLLKFNYKLNPDSNIELSSKDLEFINDALLNDSNVLETDYKQLQSSFDFEFYINQFYNLSDHIISVKIKEYEQILCTKHTEINQIITQLSSPTLFKPYLSTNRISLSESLNIKYLIEDLFHSPNL